jgi:hypothetical protein
MISILDAIDDQKLLGASLRDAETFTAWRTFLRALFALPPEDGDADLYNSCTGRTDWPKEQSEECYVIAGRRSRKTLLLSIVATFLGTMVDWSGVLKPGERGVIHLIAAERKQARIAFRYIKAALNAAPMLQALIEAERKESIDLTNGVSIEIGTASYKSTRGYTVIAVLLDEAAFFYSDEGAAEPDREIVAALRPGMASVPGAMMLVASSPHAKRGIIWEAFRRHYGVADAPALVWKAPTKTMNPLIRDKVIDRATADDASVAASEWYAEFREDIESYIARETVEACVILNRKNLPPSHAHKYCGHIDPSGGGADSFTLAIGHVENDNVVIDVVEEKVPPFFPDKVAEEYADILKRYRVASVTSDRYAGTWPVERFGAHGISVEHSKLNTSELFQDLLPMLNSGTIILPDHKRLISQIANLERKTGRNRDFIGHPQGKGHHDDLACVVAGVAHHAALAKSRGEWAVGHATGLLY